MLLDNPFPKDERVDKEAKTLIDAGYSIYLLCLCYDKIQAQVEDVDGLKIHRIYLPKNYKRKIHPLIARFPSLYRNIFLKPAMDLINREAIDFIHAHDLPMCLIGHHLKKKTGVKFVADLHENFPSLINGMEARNSIMGRILISVKAWYRREIEWLSNCDLALVTAQGMEQRLRARKVHCQNFKVIENTIKLEDYDIVRGEPDGRYITLFYSGGITIHRGLQDVVQSLKILQEDVPNLRLWIVGAGKYERELMALQGSLNLTNVVYWGWKSTKEMFDLMTRADICIIPHLKSEHTDNTSPNKVFHYFYANKPVIVSNCRYLEDLMDKTGAGLVYNSGSPSDLADRIKVLLNTGLRRELCEAGYNAVIQEYNWTHTGKKLIDAYDTLIPAQQFKIDKR